MSSTYLANIVQLLTWVFPMLGVNLGATEVSTWLTNTVAIVASLWIFVGRFRAGGVNILGLRKKT